jgi:hypothetical protein
MKQFRKEQRHHFSIGLGEYAAIPAFSVNLFTGTRHF